MIETPELVLTSSSTAAHKQPVATDASEDAGEQKPGLDQVEEEEQQPEEEQRHPQEDKEQNDDDDAQGGGFASLMLRLGKEQLKQKDDEQEDTQPSNGSQKDNENTEELNDKEDKSTKTGEEEENRTPPPMVHMDTIKEEQLQEPSQDPQDKALLTVQEYLTSMMSSYDNDERYEQDSGILDFRDVVTERTPRPEELEVETDPEKRAAFEQEQERLELLEMKREKLKNIEIELLERRLAVLMVELVKQDHILESLNVTPEQEEDAIEEHQLSTGRVILLTSEDKLGDEGSNDASQNKLYELVRQILRWKHTPEDKNVNDEDECAENAGIEIICQEETMSVKEVESEVDKAAAEENGTSLDMALSNITNSADEGDDFDLTDDKEEDENSDRSPNVDLDISEDSQEAEQSGLVEIEMNRFTTIVEKGDAAAVQPAERTQSNKVATTTLSKTLAATDRSTKDTTRDDAPLSNSEEKKEDGTGSPVPISNKEETVVPLQPKTEDEVLPMNSAKNDGTSPKTAAEVQARIAALKQKIALMAQGQDIDDEEVINSEPEPLVSSVPKTIVLGEKGNLDKTLENESIGSGSTTSSASAESSDATFWRRLAIADANASYMDWSVFWTGERSNW